MASTNTIGDITFTIGDLKLASCWGTDYHQFDFYDECVKRAGIEYPQYKEEDNMSEKDYMTSRGYAYKTEDEAVADARKYVAKNFDDVKIYKAYKVVSTQTPNVDVKDYTVPAV